MIAHRIIKGGEINKFNLVEARWVCHESKKDIKLEGIELRSDELPYILSKGLTNYLLCKVILKFGGVE